MSLKDEFESNGFIVVPKLLDDDLLSSFETALTQYAMKIADELGVRPDGDSPYALFRAIERSDSSRFWDVLSDPGASLAGFSLMGSPRLLSILTEISGSQPHELFPTTVGVFYNERSVERLQYDWHQEYAYYPNHKSHWHAWFPIFRDILEEDGPMVVCKGSHKAVSEFVPERVKDGLLQLKISDEVASKYEWFKCAIGRGDLILFHSHLIHSTSENRTDLPRMSGIVRYFSLLADERVSPVIRTVSGEIH